MPSKTVASKKTNPKNTLDIIAGIPSFNNEETISHVLKQIGDTLQKDFGDRKYLIIDCDGGSTDHTIKTFLNGDPHGNKRVLVSTPGTTGKGNVFKLLFKYAQISNANILIVNDSDLRNINRDWVKLQINSIDKKGYDYAVPRYSRYKYDGTITKHICYPLIYGLFCHNLRQPIGGDFAFSNKLSQYWLKGKWPINAKYFGIDIFMTAKAILGNYKICEVNLKSKIHDVKDPANTLTPMFRQVTSTLFKLIISNPEKLRQMGEVKEVPLLGDSKLGSSQKFDIDLAANKKRFITEFYQNKHLIEKLISKEDYSKLKNCYFYDKVYIGDEWWAKLVYDYILAFKKYESKSKMVLRSLVPLWFGRIYSFIKETQDMTTNQADKIVLKQAKEFHKQRDYLLEQL